MTFVIPAWNNLHNVSRELNTMFLTDINTPTNTGTKNGGSLPISDLSSEWDNDDPGATSFLRGVGYQFQALQDTWNVSVDTKLLVWGSQFNAPNRIQVNSLATGGKRMRIYSGTGSMPTNYKEYYLGGNDTPMGDASKGNVPFVIDLNDTSNEAGSGFVNTAVTSYAILTYNLNMGGGANSSNWNYENKLLILDTTKTSSSTATFSGAGSDINDAAVKVQGTDYTTKIGNWVRQIGSVYFIDVGFRIGDASTATTFDDEGVTVISPSSNDPTDPRNRLTTQACRVYIYLRDNVLDTADFSGTWIWGTRAPFDFGQSDNAEITLSGPTFTGMGDFEIGSSVDGNATFDDVGLVTMDSTASLDGSAFNNPYGSYLLTIGG